MLHFRGGRNAISRDAYPDLDAFYDDVAAAYRDELADARARRLHLRAARRHQPRVPLRRRRCARARARAATIRTTFRAVMRALINAAIRGRPDGMTVCVHLCRGNFKSAWAAEGGYEPVAEVLFNELDVDGYFLEYDDARSGDFAPLRFVPRDKTVVLGLVSTKLDRMETKDELKRRIDAAARFVPLDQLCLSPQCGFSSTVHGNDIHVETQAAKLAMCVDTARDVWGAL